ncbi:MAG: DUF523 and DUF1722 domain-containing protein [bacterium]|nr:DUF523 and DUF1722 domain-containing protein [bacterium]
MRSFPKPLVVISKCLEFAPCRYNGQVISFDLMHTLKPHVKFLPVCPEVEIGLGTPRDPVRIFLKAGSRNLHQPATGRLLTRKMGAFANSFLSGLPAVDGFILKGRSPSCGIRDTKIFSGMKEGAPHTKGAGLFAKQAMEKFPGLAMEDEGRLMNPACREHFFTKLFTLADFRKTKEKGTLRALIRFQEKNKLLFMACHQKEMREMEKTAANHEKLPFQKVYARYSQHLFKALARPPRRASNINTLMHAMGHLSKKLTGREKTFFLQTLERYREGKAPLGTLRDILRARLSRYALPGNEKPYLDGQTFFEPYPEALCDSVMG